MNKYPESTYGILAYKEYKRDLYNDVVDWAIDMLQYGYETENLLILAAITKPTNYFECKPYFEKVLDELSLKPVCGETAQYYYSWQFMTNIIQGRDVRQNTRVLGDSYLYESDVTDLYDYALLNWAWEDLERYSDGRTQYYWDDDLSIDSIEQYVMEHTKMLLNRHKDVYVY